MACVSYTNAKKYRHWGQEDDEPHENEMHARAVRELSRKQLSMDVNITKQLKNKDKFVKSTSHESVIGTTAGVTGYKEFRALESSADAKLVLRSLGLTEDEVRLLCEERSSLEAADVTRRRLEAVERKISIRIKTRSGLNEGMEDEQKNTVYPTKSTDITQTSINKEETKHKPTTGKNTKKNEESEQRDDENAQKDTKIHPSLENSTNQIQENKHNRMEYTNQSISNNKTKSKPIQTHQSEAPLNQDLNPQEEEDEEDKSNPYEAYLTNQLREIAQRLFPDHYKVTSDRRGAGIGVIDIDSDKTDCTPYLTEEPITDAPIYADNPRKRKGKSDAELKLPIKRNLTSSDSNYSMVGDELNSKLKKCTKGKYNHRKFMDEKEKIYSQFVYLTEKPKSFWDMEKIPKIIQSESNYPSVDTKTEPSETVIHVTKTTHKKGSDQQTKTIENKADAKTDMIIEVRKNEFKMDRDKINMKEEECESKTIKNNTEAKTEIIIKVTNNELKTNSDKTNKKEEECESMTIQNMDTLIKNTIGNTTNERKTDTNKQFTHRQPQTKTNNEDQQTNTHGNSNGIKTKTIIQVTKSKTKNEQEQTEKNRSTHESTRGSRTVIRVTKDERMADTSKPFVLTLPQSRLVPVETIRNNRIPMSELRKTQKFSRYEEGKESRVLYLKNMVPKVTAEDLASLMGHFETTDGPRITYRVLGGRMRGQAFVTFPDACTATAALNLCNGFVLHGRPLVIAYGKAGVEG